MTKREEQEEKQEKISKHKFFFELPLYTPVGINSLENDFKDFFNGSVDAYSPKGMDTTYGIKIEEMRIALGAEHRLLGHHLNYFGNFFGVSLICRRKGHILRFFIFFNEEKNLITKIGQRPSLADLQYAEIGKKYDKILPKQDLHDLKKAIGLMAHGAGAGSLVYLRRIFENIIFNTHEEHKDKLKISDDEFKRKRMDEKVNFLKKHLPSELVEMKNVYGILSKGIHELSEEECLAYFPALKLSIELILDQKIEEKAENKKKSSVKEVIKNITQKLNGKE